MARITVNALPDVISGGNVVDNILVLPIEVGEGEVAKITVTSGGPIKFNSVGLASLSDLDVAADDFVFITIGRGREIHFLQTAVGDEFRIEI